MSHYREKGLSQIIRHMFPYEKNKLVVVFTSKICQCSQQKIKDSVTCNQHDQGMWTMHARIWTAQYERLIQS